MTTTPPTVPLAGPNPPEEWLRAWLAIAHSDIQWAKGQGWQSLQWTIILLGAILAAAKNIHSVPPGLYVVLVVLTAFVSIVWLFDLHSFAKKARATGWTVIKGVPGYERYLSTRDFDPDHYFYLAVRVTIVLAAATVILVELLKAAA